MGLGLYLYGECANEHDALLEQMAARVLEHHGEVVLGKTIDVSDEGHRTLWLRLHPAEEPLTVSRVGRGRLLASARTSGAGPGYHAFVCEVLDELASAFSVRWQGVDPTNETGDDTSYFHERDRSKLENEMRGWLRGVAQALASRESSEWRGVAVGMPVNAPLYEGDGAATALGPRDAAFFRRVSEDDAVAEQFFPWWEPGTGAGYLLGRALCRMWCDVRWRRPANGSERALHDEVLELLSRARELDPERDYPYSEWAELKAFRGEPPEREAQAPPRIGYRRGTVLARPFPGVTVRIPGAFQETYTKRGGWSAWDERRTVWVSLLASRAGGRDADLPVADAEPRLEKVVEDDEHFQRLTGKRVARRGDEVRVAVVSVVFAEERDADWAIETWRSVQL